MSTDNSPTRIESAEFERLERAANDEGFLLVPDDQSDRFVVDSNDTDLVHSIDGYELVRRVGSGGSSIVYLGHPDAKPHSSVAIKIFNCSVRDTPSRIRFNRETTALKRLDHPNVAKLIDFGITQDKHPYIIFDFIDGNRIDDYCSERNLSVSDRVELMVRICFALQHAHDQGIVHRDLKPSNVIVDRNGCPFLTDFGLSKLFDDDSPDSEETRTGVVLGTLNYLAPEQLFAIKNKLSTRTDVFGLGAVLHVLLTGKPPFDFDNVVEAATSYFGKLPTRLDVKGLSPDLEAICIKCLSANPKFRYSTARAVAADLGRFLDGEPVKAKRPSLLQRYSLFSRQYPYLAWGVPLVVATLLGFSSVVFGLWQKSEISLQQADESRYQLLQAMEDLSEEIRALENSPETLHARISLLRIICDTYSTQEDLFESRPDVLYQSAVADFKLADLELSKANVDASKKYWERARDKFASLLALDPTSEKVAFDLFHSFYRLYQYQPALDQIRRLVDDFPENPDYRDALCTIHFTMGDLRFRRYDFADARLHYEAGRIAAESLPDEDPDGRFRRKKARTEIALARLSILEGDLEAASDSTARAVEINLNLKPLSHSTFGESVEYLNSLQHGLSIAAFRGDLESAQTYFIDSSEFYELARQRYAPYVQVYQAYCRILKNYAAFCYTQGMVDEFQETIQEWGNVINDWQSQDDGSYVLSLEKIMLNSFPFWADGDPVQMVVSRTEFLHRLSDSIDFDVGRSYLIEGELEQARRFFENVWLVYPEDIRFNHYAQWFRHERRNADTHFDTGVSVEQRRMLLATSLEYKSTLLESMLLEDAKSFWANFAGDDRGQR